MCGRRYRTPIIFPISNPTEKIEAMPADVLAWSGGKALVAIGIPVDPVRLDGTTFTVGQASNAVLYPGLGRPRGPKSLGDNFPLYV